MLTSTTTLTQPRRRYPLRRSPPSRKRTVALHVDPHSAQRAPHASGLSREGDIRPVLVPLHPNLRRLPSRIFSGKSAASETLDPHMNVQIGSKRKRVASGSNENIQTSSRSSRAAPGKIKRLRRSRNSDLTSDEDEASSMDLDDDSSHHWPARMKDSSEDAESAEEEEEEEEDSEGDSEEEDSDDYLISSAPSRVLKRLNKPELLRLYNLAGLADDAELWKKPEIVYAIINAREDVASLPPSSPPGREGSSDYSSDDVMPSEDEESTPRHLKRRVTTNNIEHVNNSRPLKSRSLSMGHLDNPHPTRSKKKNSGSRRSVNSRSSPTPSGSSSTQVDVGFSVSSPPAHHLRSRKASAPSITTRLFTPHDSSGTSLANFTFVAHAHNNRKGKTKHVDFDESVQEASASRSPSKRAAPQNTAPQDFSESDLTELEELETQMDKISPRRLRSKDKDRPTSSSKMVTSSDSLDARRVTPMRKAKDKITSLKEESELSDLTTSEEEVEDEKEDNRGEDEMDEDEVDELVSTASDSTSTVDQTRRTPLRKRLRPRKGADHTDPSDGDDEHEEEEEEEEEEDAEGDGDDELQDDEETIAVEPRRLRNGKIVGEEDVDMDEEDIGEEEEEEDGEEVEDAEEADEAEDADEDEEGESEEEAMEDENDVDLTIATAKTLVRLRRNDLVRLCETRDLEPVGNKNQLAKALLQWRDRHTNDFSSPSSTGTVHPPATVKRRTRRRFSNNSNDTATPPVLLRSDRVHTDEPRTPPKSEQPEKIPEPELELDLGTLGLEDREIPPEKLQKLEKIGSGGFKDVFIGKLKGRKIAISEFRGQLSAMDIKELKLLGGFDHQNIVRFLGVSIPENTKETPVMIISELCTNGDLFDYIRNVNPPSMYKVLTIMLDIARGLEYLHTRKPSVIHRDCKSSNILITSKGVAKIADFGLAKVKQSTRSMVRSLVGTVNWQAPELWHAHPKYNHKVDVFSCACVYWEMLQWHLPNKKFPWEGMNEHAIYEAVGAKKQRPSLNGLRQRWCPEVVDLIERMWAQEHQDRPTMSEVVNELQELVAARRP